MFRRFAFLVAVTVVISGQNARLCAAESLAYKFKPDQTYAYDVKVEVGNENLREVRMGRLNMKITAVTPHGFSLIRNGLLTIETQGAWRRGRVGAKWSLDRVSYLDTPAARVVAIDTHFDARGRLAAGSDAGRGSPLLGDSTELMIEPLPEHPHQTRWEVERETTVTCRSTYHAPRSFGKAEDRVYDAREKTSYSFGRRVGNTIIIEKQYTLLAKMALGGGPAVEIRGKGEAVFDIEAGMVQESSFGGVATVRLGAGARIAVPFRQTIRRVPQAEMDRLAQEAKDAADKLARAAEMKKLESGSAQRLSDAQHIPLALRQPPTAAHIDQALKALDDEEPFNVIEALITLASVQPDGRYRTRVMQALDEINRKYRNTPVGHGAYRIREIWDKERPLPSADIAPVGQPLTTAQIKLLLTDLATDDTQKKRQVIVALGTVQGNREVAEAVARYIDDRYVGKYACDALRTMGPVAAQAVSQYLKSPVLTLKREAEALLKDIGTDEQRLAIRLAEQDQKNRHNAQVRAIGDVTRAAQMPAALKKPLTPEQIQAAIADLRTGDTARESAALVSLAGAQPDTAHKAAVLAALDDLMKQHPRTHYESAIRRTREVWTTPPIAVAPEGEALTPQQIQLLLKDIDDQKFTARDPAIDALAKLTDNPAVAAKLAAKLQDPFARHKITGALKRMGPIAAEPVMRQAMSGDTFVAKSALEVLKEIGTMEQIPALQRLATSGNVFIEREASEAARAIEARQGQ